MGSYLGSSVDISSLTATVRRRARDLGFDLVRIVSMGTALHWEFFREWLANGRAGEMGYLARHADKRQLPELLADRGLPFRSMIVVGFDYGRRFAERAVLDDPSRGLIARYAWSADYHDVLRPALYELDAFVRRSTGRSQRGKALVDTGPVLERDWALASGLGFTGKNCCTIHPILGSWLLLGTLCVPEVFEWDRPGDYTAVVSPREVLQGLDPEVRLGRWQIELETGEATGTCGSCVRCLSACPTDAFVGPLHLDPGRCISYWTIESRGRIPPALRAWFGNRIFGCDVCQDVCPWNRKRDLDDDPVGLSFALADRVAPPLLEGFDAASAYWVDDELFARRFAATPLLRPGRAGMLRNVCVALGNWGSATALPALRVAFQDPEPLARGHAAWALGRLARNGIVDAVSVLSSGFAQETVDSVREEISFALD